jgi:hypothetical protein
MRRFAQTELDLGDDAAGLRPALRPVLEAGVVARNVVRRPAMLGWVRMAFSLHVWAIQPDAMIY